MTPTRVLIVDDHAIVRTGIQMLLSTEASCQIIGEADNGEEAVRKAVELQPDIVLMDVVMPGSDGIQALIMIRRLLPQIKIIVLTAYSDVATAKKAIRAGANGYLLKTAGGGELVRAIQAVQAGGTPLNAQIATHIIRDTIGGSLPPNGPHLTSREQQVLRLMASGFSNRSIADALGLKPGTVKIHICNILKKLCVTNRTEAAAWFAQQSLEPTTDSTS